MVVGDIHPERIASSRLNQLINGGFRINQRQVMPITTDRAFGFDKWQLYHFNTSGEMSLSNDALFGSQAVRVNDTSSTVAVRAYQTIEDVNQFIGETLTAQGSVKAGPNGASTATMVIRSWDGGPFDGGSRIDVSSGRVSVSNSYSEVSTTVQISNDPNIDFITVELYPGDSGNTDHQQEVIWDGATLVVGDRPVDYPEVMRPIGQEQSLCERYYETWSTGIVGGEDYRPISVSASSSPKITYKPKFSEEKSAVPTISVTNIDPTYDSHGTSSSTDDPGNWMLGMSNANTKLVRLTFARNGSVSADMAYAQYKCEAEVT